MAASLLRSQTASLQGPARYFVNYDIQKSSDSVPWDYAAIAAASLVRCGVPEGVVAALVSTWMNWRRIWCLQGRASEATWKSTNGVLQGDPTSPHVLAQCGRSRAGGLAHPPPQLQVSQFSDDIVLSSTDQLALESAHLPFRLTNARGCTEPEATALHLPVGSRTIGRSAIAYS